MLMARDAIAVKRRASGGLLTEGWWSGVVPATLGDFESWQRLCRRANLTLPNYGVLLGDDTIIDGRSWGWRCTVVVERIW